MPQTVQTSARRRDSARRERLAARVARRFGITEGTAEQWLYDPDQGVARRMAGILEECHAFGDPKALGRQLVPVVAAQRGIYATRSTAALAMQAQTADVDEELAEKAHDLNPSRATAEQLVRALDVEITLQIERRQALVNEYSLPC